MSVSAGPRWRPRVVLSGSIRSRVVTLGLLAAIPAVGMAGVIAAADFRSRERVAVERLDHLQTLAAARIDVTTALLGSVLKGAATAVAAGPTGCTPRLSVLFEQVQTTTPGLALFSGTGERICAKGAAGVFDGVDIAAADWFRVAQRNAAPVLGVQAGEVVIAVAADGGVAAGVLAANWFAALNQADIDPAQTALWLYDEHGALIASAGQVAAALPPVPAMIALQAGGYAAMLSHSAAGQRYAYTATTLVNGWRLIGAEQATREQTAAYRVLYTRLASLAGLLLLGLVVTVLGADIAFGEPLRRLRSGLTVWQNGGIFNERGLADAPRELLDLAQSFKTATTSLREQKQELDRARAAQALLMLEIHHRVKNNLQIVASLLNLQASRIRVPEARAEFQSARDRVRALATLHRHLYSEGDIHTINLPSFLAELCAQLFQAMGETEGERIKLLIQAEEVRLSTDQAVPLALIVTEAVTNAIKYGFPRGRTGTVAITLSQHADILDLVIADDGVGIPQGRGQTDTGMRDGIGLQLIRGFSRQLGATLEVSEAPGTRYSVHLPLHRPQGDGAVDLDERA